MNSWCINDYGEGNSVNNCRIEIILAQNTETYRPGETVSGYVSVYINSATEFTDLAIEKLWRTRGKGNQDSGGNQSIILHQGKLSAGTHHFDFEFVFDETPLSYQGGIININWYLKVHADIPGAKDMIAEREIILTGNPQALTEYASSAVKQKPMPRREYAASSVNPKRGVSRELGLSIPINQHYSPPYSVHS